MCISGDYEVKLGFRRRCIFKAGILEAVLNKTIYSKPVLDIHLSPGLQFTISHRKPMTWVVLSLSGWAKDIQQRYQHRRRYGLGLHKGYNFETLIVSEDNGPWTYRALFSRAQGSCHQRPRPQNIGAQCAVNKEC